MKKIILTETQLKRVANALIGEQILLKEDAVKTVNSVVDFKALWAPGKWKLTTEQQANAKSKLIEITKFLQDHNGSDVTIQIEAGESRVTNYDREVGGDVQLAAGELSKRRGEEFVNYLKSFFQQMVGSLITKVPNIPPPKTIVGTTPYNREAGDAKNPAMLEKYSKEQFVRAVITTEKEYECTVGMSVTIGYYPSKAKNRTHFCDEAIFELRMNGVPVGEVNLNNGSIDSHHNIERLRDEFAAAKGFKNTKRYMEAADQVKASFSAYGRKSDGKYGGERSQTFTINGSKAQAIKAVTEGITLSIVPLVSREGKYKMFHQKGSHSETPHVTITNKNGEVLYSGEPNVGMNRGGVEETILLKTDACGRPLNNA
jgi:hypothetical protein